MTRQVIIEWITGKVQIVDGLTKTIDDILYQSFMTRGRIKQGKILTSVAMLRIDGYRGSG